MFKELIIDSFAGGGGASLGIAWALGRGPDIAINHDADAIAMHEANHPSTAHVLEDVWRADLRKLVGRRKVGLLWASPDCKHFSRAKGGKPVEKSIRSLAWIVCKWADQVRPRMIALENVREFADWGPLVPRWVCSECGWNGTEGKAVLMRVRRKCPCCDSKKLKITNDLIPCPARKGVTFKRFIGRLRSFGYRVEWRNLDAADFGSPTHRKRLFLIARCDGQPIEWPEPTHASPSKIDSMPLFGRFKPYRMAAECIDWSIPCPSIFDRKKPLAEKTLRRIALGIKRYVIDSAEPFIVPIELGTIVGSQKHAIVMPVISRICQTGRGDCSKPIDAPLSTIVSKAEHILIAPTLMTINHGLDKSYESETSRSKRPDQTPVPTLTSKGHQAVVAAFLAKHFGGMIGVEVNTPLPTTTGKGCQNQIVAANLIHLNHSSNQPTNNHAALVYSFLVKYFGTAIGSSLINPMPTTTGKDRFGLVTVVVNGEPYIIVDIGMRMLTPRELARAQGFPDTYLLTGNKTSQVARIGNSVCPQVASAVVKVNCFAELSVS
jgi:DNA (cytosine-5)-methyltransferase 1